MVSALGSTVGIFLLWGFSTSLAPLYIFCIVYGAFAGCQSSAWSAIVADTQKKRMGVSISWERRRQLVQRPAFRSSATCW
jgi:MFS family permease